MTLLVAVDPGKMTGVALFRCTDGEAPSLLESHEFLRDELEAWLEQVLLESGEPVEVVAERFKIGDIDAQWSLPSNSAVVKNAFVPEEGHKLLSSDLDQVELRITANYSKDPGLIGLFHQVAREGGDIFTSLGRDLYSDPMMEKSDPRRALVKTYMYASLYGASVAKQAASAGVSVQTMQTFADIFQKKYPGLSRFQQGTINDVETRRRREGEGYIITPTTGRRIPVDPDKAYKGANYFIQSAAADVMKKNVIELDAMGYGDSMRMVVHDEIIMDTSVEDIESAKIDIAQGMTTTEGWDVPLTADCSDGLERWGAKY